MYLFLPSKMAAMTSHENALYITVERRPHGHIYICHIYRKFV